MAWRSPKIGVIPTFLILFAPGKILFNWVMGIDFVVTRYNDPAWIKTTMEWILTPTPKSNIVVFCIGFIWLAWLWRDRWISKISVPSPEQTPIREHTPQHLGTTPSAFPSHPNIPVTTFIDGDKTYEATYATISNTTHQTVISPGRVEVRKHPAAVVAGQTTVFKSADVEIKFEDVIGTPFYTWEIEREHLKEISIQRKAILLENHSGRDLENVSIKLERIISEDINEPSSYFGYELRLEHNVTRVRQDDKAWVRVVSYMKNSVWISIDSVDVDPNSKVGKIFRPHMKHELQIMVRADGGLAVPARFQIQLDDQGILLMKRLTPDIPNSSTLGASQAYP